MGRLLGESRRVLRLWRVFVRICCQVRDVCGGLGSRVRMLKRGLVIVIADYWLNLLYYIFVDN